MIASKMPLGGPASLQQINQSLNLWLLRLRFRDAALWGVRGLIGGLAAGLGFALMARLRPLFSVPDLLTFCVGFAGGGGLLSFVIAWLWPRPRLGAARYFDRVYNLKERTSTALELVAGKIMAPERLAQQQLADALSAAHAVDPAEGLPMGVPRREWLLMLVLLAGVAASLVIRNPQDPLLAQERAVQQAIQETAQQIEAIRQNVLDNPALSAEQRERLTRPLEEAQQQLQEGNLTREQAVAVLTQAEEQLQQLADPRALAQLEALRSAGEGLTNSELTAQLGQDLAGGELTAASRDLANLDVSNLSPAERANLAQELQQAAESLQSADPELAAQLQQASDALQRGDTQAAQQALNQASQTLAEASGRIAESQAAANAAGQVGQGRQSVARAGPSTQSQQGQGQGQGQGQPGQGQGQGQPGQGQGEGQGQGQGQSQGTGQSQGQGQGSSGAGRGEGTGQAQGGPAGSGPSASRNNGPGDGGERGYEAIYAPSRLGGSGGPEVNLPGTGDPGDEVAGRGDTVPDQAGSATVPYNQVFGGYNQAAHDAIRSGNVPIGLRPVVRDYFSSLEP